MEGEGERGWVRCIGMGGEKIRSKMRDLKIK